MVTLASHLTQDKTSWMKSPVCCGPWCHYQSCNARRLFSGVLTSEWWGWSPRFWKYDSLKKWGRGHQTWCTCGWVIEGFLSEKIMHDVWVDVIFFMTPNSWTVGLAEKFPGDQCLCLWRSASHPRYWSRWSSGCQHSLLGASWQQVVRKLSWKKWYVKYPRLFQLLVKKKGSFNGFTKIRWIFLSIFDHIMSWTFFFLIFSEGLGGFYVQESSPRKSRPITRSWKPSNKHPRLPRFIPFELQLPALKMWVPGARVGKGSTCENEVDFLIFIDFVAIPQQCQRRKASG